MDLLMQRLEKLFPGSAKNLHGQIIGGGSINKTLRLDLGQRRIFCKINSAVKFPHLFEKEKQGLELISRQHSIRTPRVIDCFEQENDQFLLLEWIEPGPPTESFWKKFGEGLAMLHQVRSSRFGLDHDNYMGSLPQNNQPLPHWPAFLAERRFHPLLAKCAGRGLLGRKQVLQMEKLCKKLDGIFEAGAPSLLHGDLWSGNFICDANGGPVLIDPAVYFGHPAMDLGMTTLFGGFAPGFYEAYHHLRPFPPNYREQWSVCNLYPLLIHALLFGAGYVPQIEETLKRFG